MYAVQTDLEERFGTAELVRLTDRSDPQTGQIDPAVVSRAIGDAEAEINGYLAARYTLPLSTVPEVLKRLTCDLARYFLYDDVATDQVRDRYKDAVALLKGIAEGKVSLGIDAATQSPVTPSGKASVTQNDRVFTRDKLTEF